ncbi:BTB/POZ domain-containing protein POB1-like [Phoenix dactylifera]|uniref:BTB/POZ domain-containing protein POB1-like n=1 Tax=Phoenix dactylifera TaxID=42345 RepID=A0A8B7MX38_PHODC|nr:BTB/POZ domain-containing protein POB1-like [Phoenix dactylifera]
MASPEEKTEADGKGNALKGFNSFIKERDLLYLPDHALRVQIVSKRPHGEERIATEESPKPEAEGSDNVRNGTYISRRSRGVDFSTTGDGSGDEVINVNSKLLSRKSDLFRKLFNEMKTAVLEEPLTIQIEASEEKAFFGLLEFIYFSSLSASSYEEIVDLLMISDEFQVLSCAYKCIEQLVHTLNSALSCFELSHKASWIQVKELLLKEAIKYVTQTDPQRMMFPKLKEDRDIMSMKDELLPLPFSGIEAIFRMDRIPVESEDAVYDFIQYWAQTHYPKPEDHSAAKELHLERLIRFNYLTPQKLEEALQSDFFHPESASMAVIEALALKARDPCTRGLGPGWCSSNHLRERRYKRPPVTVNRLWYPEFDRCEVYCSLTMSDLLDMFHSIGSRESEDFQFGHQLFSLVASCKVGTSEFSFELCITAKAEILGKNVYATRFLAMKEVDDLVDFVEMGTGTFMPSKEEKAGCDDLLPGFWPQLLTGTGPFIHGGILLLCVEITCRR